MSHAAPQLSRTHQQQLTAYLRFAQYKRRTSLREVRTTWRACQRRLLGPPSSTVYTHADVVELLGALAQEVTGCVEQELQLLSHSQVVLVLQFLASAQASGVELNCALEQLEDRHMLDRVARLEAELSEGDALPEPERAVQEAVKPNAAPIDKPIIMHHIGVNTDPGMGSGSVETTSSKLTDALVASQHQVRALQDQVAQLQADLQARLDQSTPVRVLLGYLEQKNEVCYIVCVVVVDGSRPCLRPLPHGPCACTQELRTLRLLARAS
jgi:hypothetical protein